MGSFSGLLGMASPASSAALYSFIDDGTNVTGILSGSLNLENAFTFEPSEVRFDPAIVPSDAGLVSGPGSAGKSVAVMQYGVIGPKSWGAGDTIVPAVSSTGSSLALVGNIPQSAGVLFLPLDFAGGSLAGSIRFAGTLAALGARPEPMSTPCSTRPANSRSPVRP